MSMSSTEIAVNMRADVLAKQPEPTELDIVCHIGGDGDKMDEVLEVMIEALAMVISLGTSRSWWSTRTSLC